MIGLEFICKVFDIQYKEVAERIGVSNQTVTDWIKGKTSKIPEKRLDDLLNNFPEFRGIKKELFSKKLSPSDKQKITTVYLINDVQRQLKESVENKDVNGMKEALELTKVANEAIIYSINLDSLILISEHLANNKEFMKELDQLILKYKPELNEFLN